MCHNTERLPSKIQTASKIGQRGHSSRILCSSTPRLNGGGCEGFQQISSLFYWWGKGKGIYWVILESLWAGIANPYLVSPRKPLWLRGGLWNIKHDLSRDALLLTNPHLPTPLFWAHPQEASHSHHAPATVWGCIFTLPRCYAPRP